MQLMAIFALMHFWKHIVCVNLQTKSIKIHRYKKKKKQFAF